MIHGPEDSEMLRDLRNTAATRFGAAALQQTTAVLRAGRAVDEHSDASNTMSAAEESEANAAKVCRN